MRKNLPEKNPARCNHRTTLYARSATAAAVFVMLLAAAMLAGCSSGEVREDIHSPQTPLIWPNPPEPARISYSRTIENPGNIGANRGFFKRLSNLVFGEESNAIIKPYGIAVDSKGRILVADTAFKRVHIYDIANKKYDHIDEAGDTELQSPISVAVDADDNIYVTDSVLARVFAFNRDGKFLFEIKGLTRPTGLAVNKRTGRLYVTDTGKNVVEEYDLKGKRIRDIGGPGDKSGEFNFPVDLFVDINGDLYVVDAMNYRVQIFDRDGKFLTMFGHHGDGTGDFGRPKGVAVDNDGNIYVADALFDTVQIFNRKGAFLLNFGALGRQAGFFWLPTGVFIDETGKIYVADSYNKRIQIFDYLGNG